MSEQGLRLHPIIIVENTIRTAIGLLVLIFVAGVPLDLPILAAIAAVALVVLLVFYYRQWKLTLVRFGETDIVVERKTLFKLKKTIPYSRIASVNLNRGILNRLSGTSKLMVNINSGYNAIKPEASLTFEQYFADQLRNDISHHIYRGEMPSFEETEPLVRFTTMDVILHGLFSVSTQQTIIGGFFLLNSIVDQYRITVGEADAGPGGTFISLLLFFIFLVLPAVRHMIYYYGFKVHRQGDTIFLEHGLIRTYKTSFRISRINAIRVKNTLASRLLRRSSIEAEVVGIGSDDGSGTTRPLISLLANDAKTQSLLQELVPEFIYERQAEKQPAGARRVLITEGVIASVILIAVMAYPSLLAYDAFSGTGNGIIGALLPYAIPIVTALVVAAIAYSVSVSLKVREVDTGEELFTFVNGILDREAVIMSYDKVQMVHVVRGPLARHFDVSSAQVFLLSSMGKSMISSGLFPEDRLEKIGNIVMERAAAMKH